jgi:MraZ protein
LLVGQYKNKIGAKKRVAFPKSFRDEMGKDLVITNGYEGCLVAVDQNRWKEITKEIVGGSFIDKNIRDAGRFLLGGANEINLDNQGRFVIPEMLFDYGDFEEEVVFLGLVNWVEIWDLKKWQDHQNYVEDNSGQIAQKLADIVNSAGKNDEKKTK